MKTFLQIILIILFFLLTILFNIGLVDVRLSEMNYLLGKAAKQKDISRAMGIVSKYRSIKKQIETGMENTDDYKIEARIQALTSGDQFISEKKQSENKIYTIPVKIVLRGIRFMLGKKNITIEENEELLGVLEIAYFWERVKKYKEAINVYKDVLDMQIQDKDIISTVLIHKAFCHSMLGEYENAKQIYELVISKYPDTESGILSWKLLEFIKTIEKSRKEVSSETLSNLQRAKKYYLVMDYRNAIKYYSRYLDKRSPSQESVEAYFFKGRSHEELGETEEALRDYETVIENEKKGKWAREANRRKLMIGRFYRQRDDIAESARKQLAAYHDENFLNKMDKISDLVSGSSIRKELLDKMNEKSGGKDKEILDIDIQNLLDEVGQLDLSSSESDMEMEKELQKALKNRDDISKEDIKEIKRNHRLRNNPYRRPSALKDIINKNSSQLRYIYNRQLRKGEKLSGRMVVSMEIKSGGSIGDLKVINSNLGDRNFEQEVLEKIKTWKFRRVDDELGSLTINFPFEFYKEDL